MLQLENHLNLLSVQYLVYCLNTDNVCHHITTMDHALREMKETLFTRHTQTVNNNNNCLKSNIQKVQWTIINDIHI